MAFSAAIEFQTKNFAPCFTVLYHSYGVGLDTESSGLPEGTPSTPFPDPRFMNIEHFLYTRHKPRVQDHVIYKHVLYITHLSPLPL